MRFGELLSEIEVAAERIRLGLVEDIGAELLKIQVWINEARALFAEVSREALDKVVVKLKEPLPADTEIEDVLPDG